MFRGYKYYSTLYTGIGSFLLIVWSREWYKSSGITNARPIRGRGSEGWNSLMVHLPNTKCTMAGGKRLFELDLQKLPINFRQSQSEKPSKISPTKI